MYPKNAASPEPIAIGAVVQITDGAVQTSGCTVRIKPIGVAEGDGAGTTAYSTDGIVYYTPTQAETNYTSFILIAKKTGCIPVALTVVTTSSATPGTVLLAPVTHTSAVVPTVSTVSNGVNVTQWLGTSCATPTVAGVPEVDITYVNGSAITGTGTPDVNVVSISGDTVAADNAEAFFDGTGYAGTGNVIPTVTTVNGLAAGVITAASIASDAITDAKVASDVTIASVTGAVGSVTGNVGGNVTGSVGSLATQAKADVNAEVLDVLSTDTFAELAAIPAATSSLKDKLTWMFMWFRNKVEQTATTKILKADNGSTTVATFTESDDGTTYTSGEGV